MCVACCIIYTCVSYYSIYHELTDYDNSTSRHAMSSCILHDIYRLLSTNTQWNGIHFYINFLLNSTSQEGNSQEESLFQNQYFLFECILPRTGTVDSIIIFQSCFVFNGFEIFLLCIVTSHNSYINK